MILKALSCRLDYETGFFQEVFAEKPSPSCQLYSVYLIWLDSVDWKENSDYDGMVWLISSDKWKAPLASLFEVFSSCNWDSFSWFWIEAKPWQTWTMKNPTTTKWWLVITEHGYFRRYRIATIAFDEAMILEVNARIALRFQLSFTILTVKKCSARSDVFFAYIPHFQSADRRLSPSHPFG